MHAFLEAIQTSLLDSETVAAVKQCENEIKTILDRYPVEVSMLAVAGIASGINAAARGSLKDRFESALKESMRKRLDSL